MLTNGQEVAKAFDSPEYVFTDQVDFIKSLPSEGSLVIDLCSEYVKYAPKNQAAMLGFLLAYTVVPEAYDSVARYVLAKSERLREKFISAVERYYHEDKSVLDVIYNISVDEELNMPPFETSVYLYLLHKRAAEGESNYLWN